MFGMRPALVMRNRELSGADIPALVASLPAVADDVA